MDLALRRERTNDSADGVLCWGEFRPLMMTEAGEGRKAGIDSRGS